jgi:hypothetical protein
MFARRVLKSGECSLGRLYFFEGLTFWAPVNRDLAAENFPFWSKGLLRIERCFLRTGLLGLQMANLARPAG